LNAIMNRMYIRSSSWGKL